MGRTKNFKETCKNSKNTLMYCADTGIGPMKKQHSAVIGNPMVGITFQYDYGTDPRPNREQRRAMAHKH